MLESRTVEVTFAPLRDAFDKGVERCCGTALHEEGDASRPLRHGSDALEVLLGTGAVGGGVALMAGPNGEILPLPVSALAGSPFANYFAPGAILFAVLGLGPLAAAVTAWRRYRVAPFLALAAAKRRQKSGQDFCRAAIGKPPAA